MCTQFRSFLRDDSSVGQRIEEEWCQDYEQFRILNHELVGKYNVKRWRCWSGRSRSETCRPNGVRGHHSPKIMPKEITRTYLAPRIIGWRY